MSNALPFQTAKQLAPTLKALGSLLGIELPISVYFDLLVPKKRIMEIYLNIAEWGPNIYGAEAAAQYHFGKGSAELTAREAALLAVTLPNPLARTPGNPTANLSRLAATIERRASQAGDYVGCLE